MRWEKLNERKAHYGMGIAQIQDEQLTATGRTFASGGRA
ncbi:hypothetical protein CCAE64S_02703 [Castellaniella caeni]